MEKAYLQWNVVNWLTVVLMASVGMMLFGAAVAGLKSVSGSGE